MLGGMSAWEIEVTDQFQDWYGSLSDADSESVDAAVDRLTEVGPTLGRPVADTIHGSRLANLKELRPTQTVRVFFAFDPRRTAVLLIGGDKRGDERFYETMVPLAERLYEEHLEELRTGQ
jgi:hypothetical protein